jgi:carboxymethylenebutenolidase
MGNVRTEEVKLKVDGQEMSTFIALPEGKSARPAVLVFEEIFGINKFLRDVAQRLAGEGYVAVAPDYHHRAWPLGTQLAYDEAGHKKGMEVIPKLTVDGITADVNAVLAYLKTRTDVRHDKLGAIGFCIGGHAAFLAAATQPVNATASFYGGGIAVFSPGGGAPTVTRAKNIKGKIICFFGKNDKMIPPEQVATIRKALDENKVRNEVVEYADAGHAFFCDAPERGSYNAKAAADAWERVKRMFKEELG